MPAPVSTKPSNTEEPATNLTGRLSFDLRLLIATVCSPFELLGRPVSKSYPDG